MKNYHDLAIYDAKITISGIIDRAALAQKINRTNPLFEGTELDTMGESIVELWGDLYEVLDKWDVRRAQGSANDGATVEAATVEAAFTDLLNRLGSFYGNGQ